MENPRNILCNTISYNYEDYPSSINLIKNPFGRKMTGEKLVDLIRRHDPVGIIAGIEPITEEIIKKEKNLKAIARC